MGQKVPLLKFLRQEKSNGWLLLVGVEVVLKARRTQCAKGHQADVGRQWHAHARAWANGGDVDPVAFAHWLVVLCSADVRGILTVDVGGGGTRSHVETGCSGGLLGCTFPGICVPS